MRKIRDVLHYRHTTSLSLEAIARALGLSKGVVSKYLAAVTRAGLSLPEALAMDDACLAQRLKPPASPRTSQFQEPDCAHIHNELKRDSMTLMLLWEEYCQKAGDTRALQYTAFCGRYRQWIGTLKRSMRQAHRAGEKLFADFAGQTLPIIDQDTGEISQAQIFVAALGASSYSYACATPGQKTEDWLQGLSAAMRFMGGVPEMIVPDNPRALVSNANPYEPTLNRNAMDFATHYDTVMLPARPRKPQDKAKVEVAVQVVQRWVLARLRHRQFFSLTEANAAIAELMTQLNERPFQKLPGCRREAFERLDARFLRPLPERPYVMAQYKRVRVNIDYHIEFEGHYYSVPHALVRQELEVRATRGCLEVMARGQRVAVHARSPQSGGFTTVPEHMPAAHRAHAQWTPQKLMTWASRVGPATGEFVNRLLLSKRHPEQGYRACLGLMRLGREFGQHRLENACARALQIGAHTYRSVKSILDKGLDEQPPVLQQPELPLPLHTNVRGSDYYQ